MARVGPQRHRKKNYLNKDNINNNFMESEGVTDEPA